MVGVWNKNAKQENSLEFQHPKSSEFQYFPRFLPNYFPIFLPTWNRFIKLQENGKKVDLDFFGVSQKN